MRKVLVTGAAGYIGSHMVLALRDASVHVVALDNLSTGCRQSVPEDIPFFKSDVGEESFVRDLIERERITDIVHFAASCVVPDSIRDPIAYYRNNTANLISLVSAAAASGVDRFLFSSTAAVYGGDTEGLIPETAPLAPKTPYGASKLMGERILFDVAASGGMKVGALRYFNVAGADPGGRAGQSTKNATHLVKVCVEAALGKRAAVEVFGLDFPTPDGTGVRDYIHVTDLASAHMLVLDALESGASSDVVNCGYGRGYSVLEVIAAVERVGGRKIEVKYQPRRPGDLASVIADSSKLQAEYGWKPNHADLDLIVQHAFRWEARL